MKRTFTMSFHHAPALLLVALTFSACTEERPSSGCGICDDGCDSPTCTVTCVGEEACADRTLECPEGLDCTLNCDGADSCDGMVLFCPPGQDCTMKCEGTDACGDASFNCSTGSCSMECGEDVDSCEGAEVSCGEGPCNVTCAGSVSPTIDGCTDPASCAECT